ncbi:MAG: ribonuclease E/G [Clostridia bacterium]|nr:ribonuclease E/G [Clostridia bacterium]
MKNILVSSGLRYKKVALLEDNKLVDFYISDNKDSSKVGNIYLGIVKDSQRKFDCVFVDLGLEKNAYLQGDHAGKLPLEGEKVLVSVIRDDTDTKGVAISTDLTFASRFVVLMVNKSGKNMPTSKIMFGKDFDKEKESQLRKELKSLDIPEGFGIIVRSEAANVSVEQIKEDYVNQINKYNKCLEELENFKKDKSDRKCRPVYEKDYIDYVINDFYDSEVKLVETDDEKTTSKIKERFEELGLSSKLVKTFEKKDLSMFETYKVDEELKKALGPYAWLKSGGQIIINYTEALTVIDVNSGKTEGKKNLEESSLKVNLEAAREIARQIRLRNISGIIIVDFINQKDKENEAKILKELKDATSKDKTKVNVLGFTKLGLCEMTRQKKRKMLKDIYKP